MKYLGISFIIYLVLYLIILLVLCHKSGKFLKTALLFILSGVAAFTVVNIISSYTGVSVPVNLWTVGTSAALGLPGVLGLLLIRMFF